MSKKPIDVENLFKRQRTEARLSKLGLNKQNSKPLPDGIQDHEIGSRHPGTLERGQWQPRMIQSKPTQRSPSIHSNPVLLLRWNKRPV